MRKRITYSSKPSHAARMAHARGDKQFRNYDTSHIRPKKSKIPVIVAIVLALAVVAGAAWGINWFLKGGGSGSVLANGQEVLVTIETGSGARDIGVLLQENGVIADTNEFVQRVNDRRADGELKPGNYAFVGPLNLDQVIDELREGPGDSRDGYTIPEGLTIGEVAQRVSAAYAGKINAEDFLTLANDAAHFAAEFPFLAEILGDPGAEGSEAEAPAITLEGFLFPKTYKIEESATAESVIRQMLAQYQNEMLNFDYSVAEGNNISRYQVLVIASLIEREAVLDEERSTVASVIYNRLRDGMRLELDATVAYATGRPEVSPEDLAVESPYNTYRIDGLPPGSICSPGLASINAAAHPDETGYYFYVANGTGDGGHLFASTMEEHEQNIAASNDATSNNAASNDAASNNAA